MAFDLSIRQLNHSSGMRATMVQRLYTRGAYVPAVMSKPIPEPSPYAKRLAVAMALEKISNSVLADQIGVSATAIGKLMRGTSKQLTAENHVLAVRALRVDSEWLALGEGEPRPERMGVRDLDGLESQLVMLYRGLPPEYKDKVIDTAQGLYSEMHPMPSAANPFANAPPPGAATFTGRKRNTEPPMVHQVKTGHQKTEDKKES